MIIDCFRFYLVGWYTKFCVHDKISFTFSSYCCSLYHRCLTPHFLSFGHHCTSIRSSRITTFFLIPSPSTRIAFPSDFTSCVLRTCFLFFSLATYYCLHSFSHIFAFHIHMVAFAVLLLSPAPHYRLPEFQPQYSSNLSSSPSLLTNYITILVKVQ
jgi:hypothetical protein